MAFRPNPKILLCSIGNPAPYTNTLHSVGHHLLTTLQKQQPHIYPSFETSKPYGNGLISRSQDPNIPVTLWQSRSHMNNSGIGVLGAFKEFLKTDVGVPPVHGGTRLTPEQTIGRDMEAILVVLHDELELPLGGVKTKSGNMSCKGHNGLKSIREHWANWAAARKEKRNWYRIGVGIGRPESREPDDVAKYVLRPMGQREREGVEGALGNVLVDLVELSRKVESGPSKKDLVELRRKVESGPSKK